MSKVINTNRSTNCDSTKIIFKPLQDLKFSFLQQSQATSTKGQLSNELPFIKTESSKKRDLRTRILTYSNIIHETLRNKLKTAQLYDEMSVIDLKINESTKKFQNSNSLHKHFIKSFENFVTQQYEKVTEVLTELEKYEHESSLLKEDLSLIRQKIIEKSLKIYSLESTWRKYKTSQNFLLHLSHLLYNDETFNDKFQNLNKSKISQIDELLINFDNRNLGHVEFQENNFKHLTSKNIEEFLSELKLQNLKILRHKLQYEKLKDIFKCTNEFLNDDFKNNLSQIEKTNCILRDKTDQMSNELISKEKQVKYSSNELISTKDTLSLYNFIEQLYEKCFNGQSLTKSHLLKIKHIENYCQLLLYTLRAFDQNTIQKATYLNKI